MAAPVSNGEGTLLQSIRNRPALTAGSLMLLITSLSFLAQPVQTQARPKPKDNLVIVWNGAALQGVRDSRLGPPMVARAPATVPRCVYAPWAASAKEAVRTRPGGPVRGPSGWRSGA